MSSLVRYISQQQPLAGVGASSHPWSDTMTITIIPYNKDAGATQVPVVIKVRKLGTIVILYLGQIQVRGGDQITRRTLSKSLTEYIVIESAHVAY